MEMFRLLRCVSITVIVRVDMTWSSSTNTVYMASVGDTVEMGCQTDIDEPVDWTFQDKSGIKEEVVRGGVVIDRWKQKGATIVRPNAGEYALVIPDLQLEDAGTYECIEDGGFGDQHLSYLRVAGKKTTHVTPTTSQDGRSSMTSDTSYGAEERDLIQDNANAYTFQDAATWMGHPIYVILGLLGLVFVCIIFIGILVCVVVRKRNEAPDDTVVSDTSDRYKAVYRSRRSRIEESDSVTLGSDYSRIDSTMHRGSPHPTAPVDTALSSGVHSPIETIDGYGGSRPTSGYTVLDRQTLRVIQDQPPSVYAHIH